MILNSTATDTETLQKEVLTAMNNAINAAQVAINLDKKDYNNYLILGSVYEFLMTFDKENRAADYGYAKDAYNTALSLYPKNPSIYLTLAQLEYNYGENTETTIENLNKSLQVKPNYSQAFYVFSQLAVRNNDGDSALQYATQAVQADPQNIDALLQYGILLLNKTNLTMDELNQAYTAFVTILTMDPNNITAGYYLGVTYVLAGEYDQARNIINILKQLLPEDEKVAELEQFLNTSERNNPNPQNSASNTNNAENNIATTTPAGAVEN